MSESPRLLDQVRHAIRLRHYSFSTERIYIHWIKRFILQNNKRHPRDMGATDVEAFLTYLAVKENVSPSSQNQAVSAILFLYRHVLDIELEWMDNIVRARRERKIPVVFTQQEARSVIAHLSGKHWLMGSLMYGAGLRLMECLRLRVKDIDYNYRQITVHDGKGQKDRRTVLPDSITERLDEYLLCVRALQKSDVDAGIRGVFETGYDIRTVQELLGHSNVKTTMIYTHVLNRGGRAVRSPMDMGLPKK